MRRSPHSIGHLYIEGDSELVIRQMNGVYRVHSHRLRPLYNRAKELVYKCTGREFDSCKFDHIDREDNCRADSLAYDAIQYEDDWSIDRY